jgi:hypothetical protein
MTRFNSRSTIGNFARTYGLERLLGRIHHECERKAPPLRCANMSRAFEFRRKTAYFRFRTRLTAAMMCGAVSPYFSINSSGVALSA